MHQKFSLSVGSTGDMRIKLDQDLLGIQRRVSETMLFNSGQSGGGGLPTDLLESPSNFAGGGGFEGGASSNEHKLSIWVLMLEMNATAINIMEIIKFLSRMSDMRT